MNPGPDSDRVLLAHMRECIERVFTPPGNDLKEYDGAWHVQINDQWRLTFKWGDDGPFDVKIEDPH